MQKNISRQILVPLWLLALATVSAHATEPLLEFASPSGDIVVRIRPGTRLNYSLAWNDRTIVDAAALGLSIDGDDLGTEAIFGGEPQRHEIDERYATRGVHAMAVNRCREIIIPIVGGRSRTRWLLELRIFDDGVAFRYRIPGDGPRRINGESTEWQLPGDATLWSQTTEKRSYEGEYTSTAVEKVPVGSRFMIPATLEFAEGGFGFISEANLVNYSDMALEACGDHRFRAVLHDDPEGWEQAGEIVSPWRVTLLADNLSALVNSDIVRNLCPPPDSEVANADWIRAGRSTWHWLTGGRPKLEEQRRWIDGARELGFEYHLIDDGWCDWNGGGDNAWSAMESVVEYAKQRGVGIWAWVDCKYVFDPADRAEYFTRAKKAGVVGLKIDFMKPANTTWVRWYEDTLRDAAAAELMVNFHGPVKPTGRERTWPHEMTREAVRGREHGKLPSTHDTALPFVRYVQGHADYTPTLFLPEKLHGSSLAHELAMSIVFTSPYLCFGDDPHRYLAGDARDVLRALPAVWDETIVLPGSKIGELAAFARRHGDEWFVGIINGPTARSLEVDLTFLGTGTYELAEFSDDSSHRGQFVHNRRNVTRRGTLTAPLCVDGGYVGWFVPRGDND